MSRLDVVVAPDGRATLTGEGAALADGRSALADGRSALADGRSALADGRSALADGRSARWNDHRRQRRDELIDGVIDAVRAHGADVGMDQIAAALGTSKAVIYRYFADKDDLNRCVGRRLAADVVGGIEAAVNAETDDRTMLVAGVNAYLSLLENDPQLYRFVVHHRGPAGRTERPRTEADRNDADRAEASAADYTSTVDDLIVDIFASRLDRLELDVAAARPWGIAVVGAVRAVGDWWLAHPELPRAEVSDYLIALLWNGMTGAHLPPARADSRPDSRSRG